MAGMAKRWDARVDCANLEASQMPLTAWEELCLVISLSPRFAALE
jgi:hypothetical protein